MILLGKEQLFIVLIILLVCCVYFIVEYLVNSMNYKKQQQLNIESFQGSMIDQRGLDELKDDNQALFNKMIAINQKEAAFFRTDIKMASRFISKNFDIKRIVARKYMSGKSGSTKPSTQLFSLSKTFNILFLYATENLKDIVNNINLAISDLSKINVKDNKSQAIYSLLNEILTEKKTLYTDIKAYYDKPASGKTNPKYLNPEELKDIVRRRSNSPGIKPSLTLIDNIRNELTISNIDNKESIKKIRDKSQEVLEIINADVDVNKEVKQYLINLFSNQKDIFKKINIRFMGFYLPETIVSLIILDDVSDKYVKEKQKSVRESNKIADDIVNLFSEGNKSLNNIRGFFEKKSSFMIDDNQFKYFNTMDKNTKVLSNFCKKIKQMNRPKNNSLLFKRLTREFIKKKNEQIGELNGKLDNIMNEMTVKETYNKNLYNIRTSEDAQKQINAINKAKENIQNMGKLKINIK